MHREKGYAVGGSFLLQDATPEDVFIPEDFTEDHLLTKATVERFAKEEVAPVGEDIRNKNFVLVKQLMRNAAEIGLVGADVSERWGGMQSDKVTSAIITEKLGANADFLVSFAAHCGIGTLPLAYFGTPPQKEIYLPRLASAEIIGAYALTDQTAGSDAQSITATATLAPDGAAHILNGSKQWITNAGFADLFTVFAKVDGDPRKITAFLVERDMAGFAVGPEEHKIGIIGSSTCPLTFSDLRVPKENMLGNIGDGFSIAMNILNVGRFKLAAGCVGGAKALLAASAAYARDRKAFGKSIAQFGLIRQKIARMARRIWFCEGMVYRTADMLEQAMRAINAEDAKELVECMKRYAVECAVNKVYGSEMLCAVADDAVQIHGGNGYMTENIAARAYCDARINPIFEGTNEINRLLIAKAIFASAVKGALPFFAAAKTHADELMNAPAELSMDDDELSAESRALANLKKLAVMLYGAAAQQCIVRGRNLEDEQETLAVLVDSTMDIFALETGLLRAKKIFARGRNADQEITLVKAATAEIVEAAEMRTRRIIRRLYEGDERRAYIVGTKRLVKYEADDAVELDRTIADRYLAGEWKFA